MHDDADMKIKLCIAWFGLSGFQHGMAEESVPVIPGTVTLPYEMVRTWEKHRQDPQPQEKFPGIVSSTKYQVDLSTSPATIRAAMTIQHFSDTAVSIPLLPGDVAVVEVLPADLPLWLKDDMLQMITSQKGRQEMTFRLIPSTPDALVTLPCVSASLAFTGLPTGKALVCEIGDTTHTLSQSAVLGIPARGARISWQVVSPSAQEALPPSLWQWRHEVMAVENDGLLTMTSFSQAETRDGDTREAQMLFPAGVSHIVARGEQLESQNVRREVDGTQRLSLRWKGDRQLNRAVVLEYRKRVSSLQSSWLLEAPRGQLEKPDFTQFHLADQAQRKFSASGMTGPFTSQSLSQSMKQALQGRAYFLIEAPTGQVALEQTIMPLASTADAMIAKARWDSRMELDGSTLTTGQLDVQYRNGARLPLRLPEKAVLLACSVDDRDVVPIIPAAGLLEVVLPSHERVMGAAKLVISYTERREKFAPLEGQFTLRLPGTSYFIHALQWQLSLPADYSAEVAGNLTRPTTGSTAANQILLEKNLCRDETPEAGIFYNRQNKMNR